MLRDRIVSFSNGVGDLGTALDETKDPEVRHLLRVAHLMAMRAQSQAWDAFHRSDDDVSAGTVEIGDMGEPAILWERYQGTPLNDVASLIEPCTLEEATGRIAEATFEVTVTDYATGERGVYVEFKDDGCGTGLSLGKRKAALKFVKREINLYMRTVAPKRAQSGTDRNARSVG